MVLQPCGLCLSFHLSYGFAEVFPITPGIRLLVFKAGLSTRRNGGAWGCRVDGELPSALPTAMEMPMAPTGSTFLPGPAIRTKFCTPTWLFGRLREMQDIAKAGKRFSFASRMEAAFRSVSERLYQTISFVVLV